MSSTARTVLIVVLVLVLLGGPFYGYHAGWGVWPSGGLGLVLVVVLILMLLGHI
jgi:hypothetical protein